MNTIRAALRPLFREAAIAYFRWALHDLQKKQPHHPDLPSVVVHLRNLRAERARHSCPFWRWC